MPPKKKDKKKEPILINGVDINKFTREQLERFTFELKEDLWQTRKDRNFFQMERDKLQRFWELSRHQLSEERALVRLRDCEVGQSEEKHREKMKFLEQEVKFIYHDQKMTMKEFKAASDAKLESEKDDFTQRMKELLKDKKELKLQLREQELACQDDLSELKQKQYEEQEESKAIFDERIKNMVMKYEKDLEIQRIDLSMKHDMELSEVLERKNKQIVDLKRIHKKDFTEINEYYTSIILNNLSLINGIKEKMQQIKKHEIVLNKEIRKYMKENKKLVLPVQESQAILADLTRRMNNYTKDKKCLASSRHRLDVCLRDWDALKRANEELEKKYCLLENEVATMKAYFMNSVLRSCYKKNLKSDYLEKKLDEAISLVEKTDIKLNNILCSANVNPKEIELASRNVEALLMSKNTAIKNLQYELQRMNKAHDDLLKAYEGYLHKLGIPQSELGFATLAPPTALDYGPAGFVTKNI